METTRHFVATMYVVNDGTTLLHEHEKLGMWLPPGGHIDRDELPHEAALRETYEETGLEPELVAETGPYDTDQAESLPQPASFLLEDIDVHEDGRVAHQHMDFIYFGRVEPREVAPAGHDETGADAWAWFTPEELDAHEELATDVRELGKRAVRALS